jgi:hypothetical protein
MKPDPEHVAWCRQRMNMLAEGGVWGVPRSGLTYRKRGNTLVLTRRAAMPAALGSAAEAEAQWKDHQDDDFAATKEHFEAAGYTVIDESENPP